MIDYESLKIQIDAVDMSQSDEVVKSALDEPILTALKLLKADNIKSPMLALFDGMWEYINNKQSENRRLLLAVERLGEGIDMVRAYQAGDKALLPALRGRGLVS